MTANVAHYGWLETILYSRTDNITFKCGFQNTAIAKKEKYD